MIKLEQLIKTDKKLFEKEKNDFKDLKEMFEFFNKNEIIVYSIRLDGNSDIVSELYKNIENADNGYDIFAYILTEQ